MDFSKFSDDNFDIKDWINNALHVQKDSTSTLESHTSNLVMKLQLFIQEVSKSLEETSQVALNNIPRVLREIESIKIEANYLKSQMMHVKGEIQKIEENSAESMKILVEVDSIKSRMQNAANALKEADNWTLLSNSVEEHFKDGNIDMLAEKLIGMQKSLQALQGVPDYEERSRLLNAHKNRLEALISPNLVKTFNEHNLDDAKKYINIFSELDRLYQLQVYYNNCHKSLITKTWKELREDPTERITKWLPLFYDHLLSLWHREISWCGQVFPEPVKTLCLLLSQTISNLHPSIEECIKASLEILPDDDTPLPLLIEIKDITKRFSGNLRNTVNSMLDDSSQQATLSVDELIRVIESPFSDYLHQYSSLQQASLMQYIDGIHVDNGDLCDVTGALSQSVAGAFQAAEEAVETCIKFTEGIGVAGLLDSLQIYFASYFGFLDSSISEVHSKLDGKFDGDDLTTHQWSNFQDAFKLIEMCGTLMERMDSFREYFCVEFMKDSIINFTTDNYLSLSRPMEWDKVLEIHEKISSSGVDSILPTSRDQIKTLNEHAQQFAFDIIFTHFKTRLGSIPDLAIWHNAGEFGADGELPTFSLSPQAYITHVGDSLLTLPQQLEPYFSEENAPLVLALKQGRLPYQSNAEGRAHYDHHWLECFARGASSVYAENILKIKTLTLYSTRQLLADLDYYFKILSALDIQVDEELESIKTLLDIDRDSFHIEAGKLPTDSRVMKIVSQLRNIKL